MKYYRLNQNFFPRIVIKPNTEQVRLLSIWAYSVRISRTHLRQVNVLGVYRQLTNLSVLLNYTTTLVKKLVTMSSKNEKRALAVGAIIAACVGNGVAASAPTPGFETHKHIVYSAAEITLCVTIYNIYFSQKASQAEVKKFLIEHGIAVSSGGGLAFVGTKIGHIAIAEVMNWVPVIGWGVKGLLAGSITGSIGISCLLACDALA